ncbi:MAG: hypothetical protein G01um101438_673 [Parcubacteria group bacterium Gr01-1014_38]|nr:MAG: hypothetical protein G01um101438_673 [Parcubacteria group bacterium Gr01-1014_38]
MNLDHLYKRIEKMRPWRRGANCEIFRVRHEGRLLCCKRTLREDPAHRLRKELRALKLLERHGLFPGPAEGNERILVYSHIAGRILKFPVRHIPLVARYMRAYHSITKSRTVSLRTYLESQYAMIECGLRRAGGVIGGGLLASSLWNLYAQARETEQVLGDTQAIRLTPCLIHFDPHPRNIILCRERGGILFVDWAFASFGDPALDVAQFFEKAKVSALQTRSFHRVYDSDRAFRTKAAFYAPFVKLNGLCWKAAADRITEAALSRSIRQLYRMMDAV